MLVSAVMPIMSIYRLPLGQYGYTGHVINLPQDVVSFANSLLRVPSELNVLVVRKDSEQSHRDFRVHRSVVQEALTWLLENNRYYRANAIRLNEEALQRLPQDDNLTDMRSLQLGESSTYQYEPSEDLYGAIFPLHLFLMLHSRGQSKRLCSSSFKTYREDRLAPLCGPPLEEHRSMNSPLKDTLVWPSPPCFQQELQTSLDNAATK